MLDIHSVRPAPKLGFAHSGARTLLGRPFPVYLFGEIASLNLFKGQLLSQSQLPSIRPPSRPIFWVYYVEAKMRNKIEMALPS